MRESIKKLNDAQLESEIQRLEVVMTKSKRGRPSQEIMDAYHRLLWMYNEASERKWQREHGESNKTVGAIP